MKTTDPCIVCKNQLGVAYKPTHLGPLCDSCGWELLRIKLREDQEREERIINQMRASRPKAEGIRARSRKA